MNAKLEDPKVANTPRYKEFKPYILQLKEKIKDVVIKESASNTVYTSYTVNKGEQIIFCIRSKSLSNMLNTNNIHDINLIMYVALHEISHVACPEYNHTPLFKKIFKFICEEAIEMGIYNKIEFSISPKEYCGMTINDTII
jgi:predicted metal-dependent hydrolase